MSEIPDTLSSAQFIGSLDDKNAMEHLILANEAYNALAKADEIRQKIADTYTDKEYQSVYMYGPFFSISTHNMWRPIMNWGRRCRADFLEGKGIYLLSHLDDPK